MKIIYIDDDGKDTRRVQYQLYKFFTVEPVKPLPELEELINQVFSLNPDAAIVDFRLSELDSQVHYDGYAVVHHILEKREYFPVFLLTSHQDKAFVEVDDVNIVYEKGELFDGKSNFPLRVVNQVKKYHARLQSSENRILELIDIQKQRALTLEEEEELITLDSFIEKSLYKPGSVPDTLKYVSNEQRVRELLKEVNSMVEKLAEKFPSKNE